MSDNQCGRRGPHSGGQCSKYWGSEHREHHSLESGERWTDEDADRIREEKREARKQEAQAIWDLVIKDMQARDQLGLRKYGSRLTSETPIDPIRYAYEEVLDAAVYLRKLLYHRDRK